VRNSYFQSCDNHRRFAIISVDSHRNFNCTVKHYNSRFPKGKTFASESFISKDL